MLYRFCGALLLVLCIQNIGACPVCVGRVTKQTPAFFLPEFYPQAAAKKENVVPANKEKK